MYDWIEHKQTRFCNLRRQKEIKIWFYLSSDHVIAKIIIHKMHTLCIKFKKFKFIPRNLIILTLFITPTTVT